MDLRSNRFGPQAMLEIAATLKTNRDLTALDLSGNGCEDAGAKAIGTAMTYNKTLRALHFYDKSIGGKVWPC